MFLEDLFESDESFESLYVCRKVVNFPEVVNWAYRQGFPSTLDPRDFHVTICYSKDKMDWNALEPCSENIVISGGKRSIEQFNGGAIVLKVESPKLSERWQQFRDVGASSSFPDYKAHITISYKGLPEGIEAYPGDIVLGPEQWSVIKGSWTPPTDERPTGACIGS